VAVHLDGGADDLPGQFFFVERHCTPPLDLGSQHGGTEGGITEATESNEKEKGL
jgi:hypothetical protein